MDHVRAIAKERAKTLTLDYEHRHRPGARFAGAAADRQLAGRDVRRPVSRGRAGRNRNGAARSPTAIETYIGTEPHVQRHARRGRRRHWTAGGEIPAECYDFAQMPEYQRLKQTMDMLSATGVPNPYFSAHERVTRDTTRSAAAS